MEEIAVEYTIEVDVKNETEIKEAQKYYQKVVDEYNYNGGFVYMKIISGQKQGSIAKFSFDVAPIIETKQNFYRHRKHISIKDRYGYLHWDNRKNKIKCGISDRDIIWLQGYKGETVYTCVDATKAKKEYLEANPEKDINNKVLEIGDSVLYINARYGTGMRLCKGVVREFKATYSSSNNRVSVVTIVENSEKEGELSEIKNSREFIYLVDDKKEK